MRWVDGWSSDTRTARRLTTPRPVLTTPTAEMEKVTENEKTCEKIWELRLENGNLGVRNWEAGGRKWGVVVRKWKIGS